jgi:type IV pilus assembly protein PilE
MQHHGFSLIELLIILAIIAVLASFTYPSYLKQVQKSQRIEAKAALYIVAQQQEEYFLQHSSYAADLSTLRSTIQSSALTQDNSELRYQLSISAKHPDDCNADKTNPCIGYTVTATAQHNSTSESICNTMNLDYLGTETPLSCW